MKYRVLVVSIAMFLCAMTAFAEESAYPYLKAGVGYGTNYGAGSGFNNELMFNDYVSAQVGAGYLDHIGWGVGAGLTIYPAGSSNYYFSPRFTALYGRVGRVDKNDGVNGHSYDAADGIALGIGGQFPICKIKGLTGNVDVYYTEPNLPAGYEIKDSAHFKFSAGIAYAFGSTVQVVKIIEPAPAPAPVPCIPEKVVAAPIPPVVPVPAPVPVTEPVKVAVVPIQVPPVDSDGDGVPDSLDKCPGTPSGVAVDANGCPVDSDKDGVPDYLDKCPDTSDGTVVNATGCPVEATKKFCDKPTVIAISFETGKTDVNAKYYSELDKLGAFLKEFPTSKGTIEGHTDNVGGKDENRKLSQARAESVRRYIVNKYGIDGSRITAKGYGSAKPVASNKSESGKTQNRRIEAVFSCE